MVARIRLNPTVGLKVSRAAYDVDAATSEQIAFESFGDRYAGVYLSGQSASNDGSWTSETVYSSVYGAVACTRLRKTIALGKTFSAPPQVIWTLRNANALTSGDYAAYGYMNVSVATGAVAYISMSSWASCSTTELTLRVDYTPTYTGNTAWYFSYMVFQT